MTRPGTISAATREAFLALWDELDEIGIDPRGGVDRPAWGAADLELRAWFFREARRRDLTTEVDPNGNCWAWWDGPGPGAIVTGSHLDSVPNGGAFDGPLGVVSGLLAVDELRARRIVPRAPIAVVAFSDEEGSRFGLACVGSRLMTGALDPGRAVGLTDGAGVSLAEAMRQAGCSPEGLGTDRTRLDGVAAFVELHVEQGRALVDLDQPVGIASAIWPHGRWRCSFSGEANHAGTTRLEDRRDPMLPFAATVGAARAIAQRLGARSTFGRVLVEPNATNAIPQRLDAWLDARAADGATLEELVTGIEIAARLAGAEHGVEVTFRAESVTAELEFSGELRARIAAVLGGAPELPTAAGHDAGILGAVLPSAMLFVRNPSGVSHSPAEFATVDDCGAGIDALTRCLAELAQ